MSEAHLLRTSGQPTGKDNFVHILPDCRKHIAPQDSGPAAMVRAIGHRIVRELDLHLLSLSVERSDSEHNQQKSTENRNTEN